MVKLEEYPDVEVHDVIDGYGNLVKKMTIDEKIAFWQEVMEYANNRCIDIFYFTWNIHTNQANGKYGITNTENLCNLDKLVGKRFFYMGLPLKIRDGSGAPIRAVALVESV